MGIGVQPNCCGEKSIYWVVRKFTGFNDARLDWTYSGTVTASSQSYGIDVDLQNGWFYNTVERGFLSRCRTRDGLNAHRVVSLGSTASSHLLPSLRVWPELGIVTLCDWTQAATNSASLVSVDIATGATTTLATVASGNAISTVPYTAVVNLATNKVVYIEAERYTTSPALIWSFTLKQCDLDGTNTETLATYSDSRGVVNTMPCWRIEDVDYRNGTYIVSEGEGLINDVSGINLTTPRIVTRINWNGANQTTLFDANDYVDMFNASPQFGSIRNVFPNDGQIVDDGRLWFRGCLVFDSGQRPECIWFACDPSDGSGLIPEIREGDFPAIYDPGDVDRHVLGEGFNKWRGQVP